MTGVVQWFATWLMVIIGLMVLSRTAWGRPIVYGALWLSVALLVLSHAEEITQLFSVEALNLNG